MINKWHKAILVKEIDYDAIPRSITRAVKELNNKKGVLEYEPLFVELGYDFDIVIEELEQVEEKDKKNYIYHLMIEALPKKQELKHIEKAMAKFDLWNYLSSTLNEEHDIEAFSKELDKEFLEESREDWKKEKISRIAQKRDAMLVEREKRKDELLRKRNNEKASAEEEAELEYILKQMGIVDEGKPKNKSDEENSKLENKNTDEENTVDLNGADFDISGGEFDLAGVDMDSLKETNNSLSEINLDDDFTELNQPAKLEDEKLNVSQIEGEVHEESKNTNVENKKEKRVKFKKGKTITKEVIKHETVEVEVFKTDPHLISKLEEKEKELNNVLVHSKEEIERAKLEIEKLNKEKDRELEEANERYIKLSEEERKSFEEEKAKHKLEVQEREDKIEELNNYIKEHERAEKEKEELEEKVRKASTYDELKSMSKKDLRLLCEDLTINFHKKERKDDLIDKLMKKSKILNRIYNMVDVEKEVMKRLKKQEESLSGTKELVVDPFNDVNISNTADDMFSNGSDPFGNIDVSGGMDDMFGGGTDPFGNVDTSGGMDDMFGGGTDPFGNVDTTSAMDDEFSGGSDPFGNVQTGGNMDDEFSGGDRLEWAEPEKKLKYKELTEEQEIVNNNEEKDLKNKKKRFFKRKK